MKSRLSAGREPFVGNKLRFLPRRRNFGQRLVAIAVDGRPSGSPEPSEAETLQPEAEMTEARSSLGTEPNSSQFYFDFVVFPQLDSSWSWLRFLLPAERHCSYTESVFTRDKMNLSVEMICYFCYFI